MDWTLAEPDDQGLAVDVTVEGGRASVQLDARDAAGSALNLLKVDGRFGGPGGQSLPVVLDQSGSGSYVGELELPEEGAWLLRLEARQSGELLGARTVGVVVPYSPEYADPVDAPGRRILGDLVEATGGRMIDDPGAAFAPVPGVTRSIEGWPWLLLAAALLFPCDVAARRLKTGRADVGAAREWLQSRRRRAAGPAGEQALAGLFAARDRARARSAIQATEAPDRIRPDADPSGARSTAPADPQAMGTMARPRDDGSGDTLDRLREAKRRARRT